MEVEKPIIIVGTGRCGSTMLHRLMAHHQDLGWLSTFNEVFPGQTWLARFSNLYRLPFLSQSVKEQTFFPKPFESYRFWERYLPGFSRRDKPQTAEDVPLEAVPVVRKVVARLLAHQGRPRFLIKVTGWSRIAYFRQIFPDALFIFLNREPRSVVSSWVQAGWLDVTSGLDSDNWQWGEVADSYRRLWHELGATPLLSAAVKIQLDLDDIAKNMAQFPDSCYSLQFEELITKPIPELRQLLAFCQLPWTAQFENEIRAKSFYNPINKWRRYLTEREGEIIQEFFERAGRAQQVYDF